MTRRTRAERRVRQLRALIQRVREASVRVDGRVVGAIGPGLLVLAGVAADDGDAEGDWLARKIVALRIFDDEAGVMNRSVADVRGDILAVSQFTLYASTRKGNRPSWSGAAPPETAQPRFDAFVDGARARARPARSHRHLRRRDAGCARQRRSGDDLARFAGTGVIGKARERCPGSGTRRSREATVGQVCGHSAIIAPPCRLRHRRRRAGTASPAGALQRNAPPPNPARRADRTRCRTVRGGRHDHFACGAPTRSKSCVPKTPGCDRRSS